ncbi:hypothetical protein C0Q70_03121 [Pomacea canaliculata]|uniref:Uncharacterized protein n=1 Tax=Pomacea canaliculata TaxID=400727 RepID=A0A2T7PRV3_POMCA|nr:hypothetical protein C0Q70_03121 [Pomacea canaliculata]
MESRVRPSKIPTKEEVTHKGRQERPRGLLPVLLVVTVLHTAAFIGLSVYTNNRIQILETTNEHVFRTTVRNAVVEELADILTRLSDGMVNDTRRQELYLQLHAWAAPPDGQSTRQRSKRQSPGDELGSIFDEMAQKELAIFDRYCGNASKICLPGPQGQKGDPGAQGIKGAAGGQGLKGDIGPRGSDGSKGEAGIAGPQGIKGDAGQQGEKGVPGEAGSKGAGGEKGERGDKGDAGSNGVKGDIGPIGPQGQVGPLGPKGERGADGPTGQKGDTGQTGPQGQTGPSGAKGSDGADGPTGQKGVPGEVGPSGPTGPSGLKGDAGANGTPGEKGDRGETGPLGPVGPSGPKGEEGKAGIEGQKGDVGQTGPQGPSGDNGDKGADGTQGQKGDPGEAGPTGQVGPTGEKETGEIPALQAKGDPGSAGPIGPDGPAGAKGETGADGLAGQKGERGDVGPMGPSGPAGAKGETGDVGIPGAKGSTGDPGEKGEKGSDGTPGVAGSQGKDGPPGPAGIKGEKGEAGVWSPGMQSCCTSLLCRLLHPPTGKPELSPLSVDVKVAECHQCQLCVSVTSDSSVSVVIVSFLSLVCNIVISDISVVVGQSSADVIKSDVTGKMTSAELTHAEGRGKGPKPYITETSGNITVLEGQNVTLMCRSNSLPQPQIHWAYNRIDSHVYEDSREELQIEDIRKVDGGDYTCTASNKFGHTSVTLHVNVQVPPTSTLVPDLTPLTPVLFFDCSVRGDEPLNVTWAKDGVPLDFSRVSKYVRIPDESSGSHRLLIPSTSESDVGVYSCQASNYLGSQEDATYVYKNLGTVTCNATFSVCTVSVCGATCPDNCTTSDESVYGNKFYSVRSSICRSAIHAGVLGETKSATVVWENKFSSLPFESNSAHGIVSLANISLAVLSAHLTGYVTDSCGVPLVTDAHRILGGQQASSGEYPWQVSLLYNGQHLCGGTIIDSQWILTAAHCFDDTYADYWEVAVGTIDIQYLSSTHVHSVSKIYVHGSYVAGQNPYDIALMKLTTPLALTGRDVRSACLPEAGEKFDGMVCTVTGWGSTHEDGDAVRFLREVDVPILSNSLCSYYLGPDSIVDHNICAGYTQGGKDSCQGDSGGPLVCKRNGVWKLAGVVSWGYGCGKTYSPGVYTRVTSFLNWIASTKSRP